MVETKRIASVSSYIGLIAIVVLASLVFTSACTTPQPSQEFTIRVGYLNTPDSLPRFSLDGRNDPALLENMQQTMVSVGMLKALIPAGHLYDETLLDEVLKEKR